jgi:hypothetical protein
MGLGFEYSERLEGSFYWLDDPMSDHPMTLEVRARVDGLRRFAKTRVARVDGRIHAASIATATGGAEVRGEVALKLLDEKRVPYDLWFEGDDRKTYRLRGQRDFYPHDAFDSLSMLPASIYDGEGLEVGRALLRSDARSELPRMLKSLRARVRFSSTGP